MTNKIRFGEDEHTLQILRDFARRLDSEADVYKLSQVRTTLTYADGQTFTYNLNPKNFSVEEWDEARLCFSPINGCNVRRRVVFHIRDEEGVEHGPIGTTSILKDIFGLEDGRGAETERLLLDAAYAAEQEALWDKAQAAEDPLVSYAYLNGLPTHFFTANYLKQYESHYGEHNPIAAAIRNILTGRVRLDRSTAKQLRKEARGERSSQVQARAQVKAKPVEAEQPRPTVSITGELLQWIAPARAVLLRALPSEDHAEFSRLMDWAARVRNPELSQKIHLDLFHRLEALTQLSLNTRAYRARKEKGPLTESELRQLNMHLTPRKKKERKGSPTPTPVPRPELAPAMQAETQPPPAARVRAVSPQQRQLWQERVPLLRYMDVPPELLNRTTKGKLTAPDLEELNACWNKSETDLRVQDLLQPTPSIAMPTSFVRMLSQGEQAALSVARMQKKWPPGFRVIIQQRAEEHGLNPQTFLPYRLKDKVRSTLTRDLPTLETLKVVDTERIRRILNEAQPSVDDLQYIERLHATPVSGCFTLAERQTLLHSLSESAEPSPYKIKRRAALHRAVSADRYSLRQAAELRRLLASMPKPRPLEGKAVEQGQPIPGHTFTLPVSFLRSLEADEQAAARAAIERGECPAQLKEALQRRAEERGLNPQTFMPYDIPQGVRQMLRRHLVTFAKLGYDARRIRRILTEAQPTAEEMQFITELRNLPVRGGFPAEERRALMHLLSEEKGGHAELRRALEEDRYTLEQVSRLRKLRGTQHGD